MGKLDDLEKKLYETKGEEQLSGRLLRRREPLEGEESPPVSHEWKEEAPQPMSTKPRRNFFDRQIIKFFWGSLIACILLGGAAFVYFYVGTRGQEIEMRISATSPIESGELQTVPIVFKNVSNLPLHDVELAITLPAGSLVRENEVEIPAPSRITKKIGDINPGVEQSVNIATRFFGAEHERKKIHVTLLYRPENLRSTFSAEASAEVEIAYVPLGISWDVPDTIASGQTVDIGVHYSSTARSAFQNMSFKIEYPEGFTFVSSDPKAAVGTAIWTIGTLESGKEGKITIRGTLTGEQNETKTFRGSIGFLDPITKDWRAYGESEKEVAMAVSPLVVLGSIEGSRSRNITPGETLSGTVHYKNNTPYTIKNASVRVFLDGAILRSETLNIFQNGVFDQISKALVWDPGSVGALQELRPGDEGDFRFTIQTKDQPVVKSKSDTNQKITFRSRIESRGIPTELIGTDLTYEDRLEFKIRTKIIFVGAVLYTASPIANTGPIPPKVGAKTTYGIRWQIRNFTNDLERVQVKATLPANIKWTGAVFPKESRIAFDPATSEVTWTVGRVLAGVGITSPALSGTFQVSVTPSASDVDKTLLLVNTGNLTGLDTFTGEDVIIEVKAASSEQLQEGDSSQEIGRVRK